MMASAISAVMWMAFAGFTAYMGWWIVLSITALIVGYCYFKSIT
ncbi:MAG: hypothetical protein ACTSYO_07990 [Candidatus Ranarchaeia archaeon]